VVVAIGTAVAVFEPIDVFGIGRALVHVVFHPVAVAIASLVDVEQARESPELRDAHTFDDAGAGTRADGQRRAQRQHPDAEQAFQRVFTAVGAEAGAPKTFRHHLKGRTDGIRAGHRILKLRTDFGAAHGTGTSEAS